MAHPDYLKKVLTARVYDVARESELEPARNLSARLHNSVYLKREDNQPVFSFKIRGAYNKMVHLPADILARGVITASAGNHAQGVAYSATRLGCKAVIVVPVTTPQVKREDNQPVFSFKIRGAYNKMVHLPADILARGVITASAGNHA
ncbi:pyridoxal-phosphate dependent enzyme, partial [Caballeronia sp. M23-90]